VLTDLSEVLRLGTAKEKENLDFRRYLSAHHVDEEPFQILAAEVGQHIDCTACANCCRHALVTVNAAEIAAIAAYLGEPPETIARRYTLPEPGAPALRVLRSSNDGCVFLHGNLCLVYEARPKACRDFPHLNAHVHSLGSRPASHARWAALCPIIYNALEAYKHQTGFKP
jgi:Fe-S-cluster containining protein